MRKISLLVALGLVALSLVLVTTQVMAGPNAAGPSHTPKPFITGTPGTPPPPGPPSNPSGQGVGPQKTPGPPANANPNSQAALHGKPTIYKGTIFAVSASSLTLTLSDGSQVAMAITDQNNNLVARAVMAIPGQPLRVHRVGTVTGYTAGSSITIKATDGNS